jgi:[protein-PII] uridylyltransferase
MVTGPEVTVVAPDRPGLLWQAAGVLASHRLAVRSANATSHGAMAVTSFTVAHPYGEPPDAALVTSELRRVLSGELDVAGQLRRQGMLGASAARADGPSGGSSGAVSPGRPGPGPVTKERGLRSSGGSRGVVPPGLHSLAPPKVTLIDDASRTATVVEVRARDAPGLLWRIGRALGECGLDVRAARVETLGGEAVDVFYVVGRDGCPVTDATTRGKIAAQVLSALTG